MPALQVRDFPQPLYDRLKQRAEEDHRSIAQEVVFVMEGFLDGDFERLGLTMPQVKTTSIYAPQKESAEVIQERIERKRKLFEEIRANPFKLPDDAPSPEEVVRQGRDERGEHLMSVLDELTFPAGDEK